MAEQPLPRPNLVNIDHSKKEKFSIFLSNGVVQLLKVENWKVESATAYLRQF